MAVVADIVERNITGVRLGADEARPPRLSPSCVILARDGRITKSSLAEEVKLSISPAWERVKKPRGQRRSFSGYRADVDWACARSRARVVVEVTLARHTAHDMRRFEERSGARPKSCNAMRRAAASIM